MPVLSGPNNYLSRSGGSGCGCCSPQTPASIDPGGNGDGYSTSDTTTDSSMILSGNCKLCMKCFLFWVLMGIAVLLLLTGRR